LVCLGGYRKTLENFLELKVFWQVVKTGSGIYRIDRLHILDILNVPGGLCIHSVKVRILGSSLTQVPGVEMKKHLFTTIFTLVTVFLYVCSAAGQEKAAAKPWDIYAKALFASLEKMDAQWGKIGTVNYKDMVVQTEFEITEGLPVEHKDYRASYLDLDGLINRYKEKKREIPLLIGHPARTEGERLVVSYTLHYFSIKNNIAEYSLSDWSTVYFRFDCGKKEFVIDEVVLGGI
jgi:hypothetical protein